MWSGKNMWSVSLGLDFTYLLLLWFRDNDIALIIQYVFHDDDGSTVLEEDGIPKKKTKLSPTGNRGVLKYSKIKLPAVNFGYYLANRCDQFLKDCLRYRMPQELTHRIRTFNHVPFFSLLCILQANLGRF